MVTPTVYGEAISGSSTNPSNAVLDPSNPLGSLETALEFLAKMTDFFNSDSAVADISSVALKVKAKVDAEERKRKEKTRDSDNAGKEVKEEKPSVPVKEEPKEEMEEDKSVSEVKGEGVDKGNAVRAPNRINGLDLEKYSWGQSLKDVNVRIPVPPGTGLRCIARELKRNHLKVGLKGQPPIIDGELHKPVKVDRCFWLLEARKSLCLVVPKENKMEWWKCLVNGEPEIDSQVLELESSRVSGVDPDTWPTVKMMMSDQRLKSMGLPTSDEIPKRSLAEQPEMGFSRAKIR